MFYEKNVSNLHKTFFISSKIQSIKFLFFVRVKTILYGILYGIQYVQFVKRDSKWNSDYSRNIWYSMLRRTVARVVTQLPSIIYNSKIKILVGLLPTKNLLKFTKGIHFFTFLVNLF